MPIVKMQEVTEQHQFLGGKAYHLAQLSQLGFPVPRALAVSDKLEGEDFRQICNWWEKIGKGPLAVRSSAADEDGSEHSFAGQNSSFLNIFNQQDLKQSLEACFDSVHNESSQVYRKLFLKGQKKLRMNVLIQEMVQPQFAGVYFSKDPMNKVGDLIEYVEGLGESLVSGRVTPFKINSQPQQKSHALWKSQYTEAVRYWGDKAKDYLKKEVDMEWAVSQDGEFHVLQVRPITTKYQDFEHQEVVNKELLRLQKKYPMETMWDGQSFSEWTGLPSPLTFSVFEKAFAPTSAYDKALKILGYKSFGSISHTSQKSVLNSVLGRALINLNQLKPLFFGSIPYKLVTQPRVRLQFDWRLIDFKMILGTPWSVMKMIGVGWSLSSKRSKWIGQCQKELVQFQQKMNRPQDPDIYRHWSNEDLIKRFHKEVHVFSTYHLVWPFVLTVLIESTMRSLTAICENVLGKEKASEVIKRWMATGLHTANIDMMDYYQKACRSPQKRPFFLAKYGHRGAGELDLKNKRWSELGENTFSDVSEQKYDIKRKKDTNSVNAEIMKLGSFKKNIILQEWKLLKRMLELREKWKMSVLKPFAHIRFIANELSLRADLGESIFYLDKEDVSAKSFFSHEGRGRILAKIEQNKKREAAFKYYSLPAVVGLEEIQAIVNGEVTNECADFQGESLSPGLVFGSVFIVKDLHSINMNSIPEDAILVAEATDPGWTPLFSKSKGVIVERGGVLSHSAILAREMGIPAVSSIANCVNRLKQGERICLDGHRGSVRNV